MRELPTTEVELPATHHGRWAGPNRLWLEDPARPFRSDGAIEVSARALRYRWWHEGVPHEGEIALRGQPAALEARWTDTWHAKEGFTLHGFVEDGVIRLFGIFDAGGTAWGWRTEIDWRDPEACLLRMFLVVPDGGPVPAVALDGRRAGDGGA